MQKKLKKLPVEKRVALVTIVASIAIVLTVMGIWNYSRIGENSDPYTSQTSDMYYDDYSMMNDMGDYPMMEIESFEGEVEFAPDDMKSATTGEVDIDEDKVIKNAYLNIAVSNLDTSRSKIENIAKKYQGEVTEAYESGTGNYRTVEMSFKVPVDRFEKAVEDVRDEAKDVESSSVSTNDVSEEYVDVQARLENQKVTETQLQAVMEQATDVEDILAVQRELTRVRGEIESLQATINYYDRNTDYSTISVYMSIYEADVEVAPEKWSPLGIAKAAYTSVIELLKGFAAVAIWVGVYLPLVLVVVLVFWVAKKISKGKKK